MPAADTRPSILIVDPQRSSANELAAELRALGADAIVLTSADDLAQAVTAQTAAILVSSRVAASAVPPTRNGSRPPCFVVWDSVAVEGMGDWDGLIMRPISATALRAITNADRRQLEPAAFIQLLDVSLLGATNVAAADRLTAQTASIFGVDQCLWFGEDQVLAGGTEALAAVAESWCTLAQAAGTTLYTSAGDTEASVLAEALSLDGDAVLGVIALVDTSGSCFSDTARMAFRAFAKRVSSELSWLSAHHRLVEEHRELRESAQLDRLLGIASRVAFESMVRVEIAAANRREEKLSLALFNLTHLRQINDRHGHLAGDAALTQMCNTLRANVRAHDQLGRFSGDEIAVVFVATDVQGARTAANKLLNALVTSAFKHEGEQLGLEVCAGVSAVEKDEPTGSAAFARAIAAIRKAKTDGVRLAVLTKDESGAATEDVFGVDVIGDVALTAGDTLGGMYRIHHEISRGAMGVVYRAEDLGLGRPVAIKILRSDLARDKILVKRFREEAATLAALHHPNLVQVFAFGAHEDEVYFVMELVEGQPLSDVLDRVREAGETIDGEAIIKIIDEIADALDVMHGAGLIHRDVKPANILLDHVNDRAVLVDVGVAKRQTDRREAAGTPGFAAPESFTTVAETSATDVYGLAATVYIMLTGELPFTGADITDLVGNQLNTAPTVPSELRPGLASAVDQVVVKALAPMPEGRFSSASAFAVAIASALRRTPKAKAAPAKPKRRPKPETRKPTGGLHVHTIERRTISAGDQVGRIRGVFFRVALRLLNHQLGASWVAKVKQSDQSLSGVLEPSLSPMSWQPLDKLVALLVRAAEDHPEPEKMARGIGRTTMTATFARFFGADPSSLAPDAVLGAATAYWSRYHQWSTAHIDIQTAERCTIVMNGDPGHRLIQALVEGSLVRIAELAGATDVRVRRARRDNGDFVYQLAWSNEAKVASADTVSRNRDTPGA